MPLPSCHVGCGGKRSVVDALVQQQQRPAGAMASGNAAVCQWPLDLLCVCSGPHVYVAYTWRVHVAGSQRVPSLGPLNERS